MEDATTQTDDRRQESLLGTVETADAMSLNTLVRRLELQSQIQQELLQFLTLQRSPNVDGPASGLSPVKDEGANASRLVPTQR